MKQKPGIGVEPPTAKFLLYNVKSQKKLLLPQIASALFQTNRYICIATLHKVFCRIFFVNVVTFQIYYEI